jgi:hypothetical protein
MPFCLPGAETGMHTMQSLPPAEYPTKIIPGLLPADAAETLPAMK